LNTPILSDAPVAKPKPAQFAAAGPRFLIPGIVICCLAILLFPCRSFADQMVLLLMVNGQTKGEVFVHRTEPGDFLLLARDLQAAGLREPSGSTTVELEGETYLSLRSMTGISFTFDERTLTLNLDAAPALLPKTMIEFGAQPQKQVYYPKESNLFLNYGMEFRSGEAAAARSLNLSNELGMRHGDYLFLTDTIYTRGRSRDSFIRLHSSITRDDRQLMRRVVFGDLFATSGTLGSGANLGGISFSKVYGIDPFFVTYPTLELSGQASLPSEVDIYLNGAKIRTERVAPGEFQLHNFSTYGGAGVVDLVVRDSLGREQRFSNPFYATDSTLLKKGLHDYSYNAGFRRDQFGRASNRYSKPAAVALHRFGLEDYATVGWRGEASSDVINAGPLAAVRLGTLGLLNLSLSASAASGAGSAFDLSYQYLNRRFNGRLFYQQFSPGYRTLASVTSGLQPNYARGGGLSYTDPRFGSLSFDLSGQKTYQESERRTAALGYAKSFPGNISLTAILRRVQDPALGSAGEFLLGLSYSARNDLSFTARHESTSTREHDSFQVQKNPPLGEGIGYRALLERDQVGNDSDILIANPMLQYNGRYGIIRGEITAARNSGEWDNQYLVGASGALVMLEGVRAFTRPVTDSFAAVKVGNIEGVTVRYGGQDIGRTDSSGKAFITNLSAYNDNLIAINEKEIPFEYYFPQVQKLVSPPLRSGSCVGFLVKKFQPVTGILKLHDSGAVRGVEFQEVELLLDGKPITFTTGTGGEFYIDISQSQQFMKLALDGQQHCTSLAGESSSFLRPGAYQAAVIQDGRRHPFNLWVPASDDPIIDLGVIVINATPQPESAPQKGPLPESAPQKVSVPARQNGQQTAPAR